MKPLRVYQPVGYNFYSSTCIELPNKYRLLKVGIKVESVLLTMLFPPPGGFAITFNVAFLASPHLFAQVCLNLCCYKRKIKTYSSNGESNLSGSLCLSRNWNFFALTMSSSYFQGALDPENGIGGSSCLCSE